MEDKTFGLKNKNKSKNVQKYVQSLKQSVQPKPDATKAAAKKKKEEDSIRSGLGLPVVKGEGAGVTYDTQISGAKQNWIPNVYALAVRITEEAIDDNLYELNGGGGGDFKELFTL